MKKIKYINCADKVDNSTNPFNNYVGVMFDLVSKNPEFNEKSFPIINFPNNNYNEFIYLVNIIFFTNQTDTFDQNIKKISDYIDKIIPIISKDKAKKIFLCSSNIQIIYALQQKNLEFPIGYFIDQESNFVDVDFYIIPITRLEEQVIREMIRNGKKIMFFASNNNEYLKIQSFLQENFANDNQDNFFIVEC